MTHAPHARTFRSRILAVTAAAVLAASMTLTGCSDESSEATDSGAASPAGQSDEQVAELPDDQSTESPDEQNENDDDSVSDDDSDMSEDSDEGTDEGSEEDSDEGSDADSDDELDDLIADNDTLSFTLIDGLCVALENLRANRTELFQPGALTPDLVDELFGPIDPHIDEIANEDLRENLEIMSEAAHAAAGGDDQAMMDRDVLTAQAKVSGTSAACS